MLVSLTAPTTAFKLGEKPRRPGGDVPQRPRHHPGQPQARRPGISVPSGLAEEDRAAHRLPGPRARADDRVYRVGAALEALLTERWGGSLLDRAPTLDGTLVEPVETTQEALR